MNYFKCLFSVVALLVLSGCAATQKVDLPDNFWQDGEEKTVAIAFVKPPEMNAHRSGAQGLLDLAINEAVTDTVESHIQTLQHDRFESGKSMIAQIIESRGSKSIILAEYYEAAESDKKKDTPKGYFEYDLTGLQSQHGVSHLLVVYTHAAGTLRDYYGFIPLSDPRGYVSAEIILVDAADNKIVMKEQIIEQVTLPEGVEWDDPENGFPEITKVVHQALEKAADRLPLVL